MANTGYQISPTVRQYFTSGPNSGSIVSASFDVDLTVSPFSASLNNEDYFYRSFNPIDCEPGFENCLVPLLTSLTTGSQRGRFAINYVTQSSSNSPIDITASISNDPNFGTSEIFSASIDSLIPVTTSFVSGTVYFKAFTSCSGPDPSPDSSPLSFTYDLIPPISQIGEVSIIFKNNLSSPMEVEIRSLRGNINYDIEAGNSITYDYKSNLGKSKDLVVTIKGGAKSQFGNIVQRTTSGIENETYTTGGGYNNPLSKTDDSSTFTPDKGLTFNIQQLSLPKNSTTTTFTLLNNTPESEISLQFGSTPYPTEDNICANTLTTYKEKTYYEKSGYLYNSRAEALDDTKPTFPYLKNYILTGQTSYLVVNQKGYIQYTGECSLPTLTIETELGSYPTQEEACKRNKTGGTTFNYKDNKLVENNLSGRYPLYEGIGGRGGTNVILSIGNIIGYETCGSELTTIQYGGTGWLNSTYPLLTPENINPIQLNIICADPLIPYSLGPSGTVYYHIDTQYAYIPLGYGDRWFKALDGTFINFNNGQLIDTTSPC